MNIIMISRITLEAVTMEDVVAALASTKPSARGMKEKYIAWQQEFESA